MPLMAHGESLPLETLMVVRGIVKEIADRLGAKDVRYCTMGVLDHDGHVLGKKSSATTVVYELHPPQIKTKNKPNPWSVMHHSLLIEFDIPTKAVCCGRVQKQAHEMYSVHPIKGSIEDPELVDKIVQYVEIISEVINPEEEPKPTLRKRVTTALKSFFKKEHKNA